MRTRHFFYAILGAGLFGSCSTLPTPSHKSHKFPEKRAYFSEKPPGDQPYEVLGLVRSRADYSSLDMEWDEKKLCQNYFNKAVNDLVRFAKEKGGDAVVQVRSVVFLLNERVELYSKPECADDGNEGQVLTQGLAIRYLPPPVKDPTGKDPVAASKAAVAPAKP